MHYPNINRASKAICHSGILKGYKLCMLKKLFAIFSIRVIALLFTCIHSKFCFVVFGDHREHCGQKR